MEEITPEKNYTLLLELTEYVKNNVATKQEVDYKIGKLDDKVGKLDDKVGKLDDKVGKLDDKVGKLDDKTGILEERLDRLTDYVLREIPDIKKQLEEKADKKDIQKILDGQDAMVNQLDIIRTEQYAFNAAFRRIEKRVEVLELEM